MEIELLLDDLFEEIINHKKLCKYLEIENNQLKVFEEIYKVCYDIKLQLSEDNIDSSYKTLYYNQLSMLLGLFPYRGKTDVSFLKHQNTFTIGAIKDHLSNNYFPEIEKVIEGLSFQIDLFNKIGYFQSHIVIVGANGSGKTSLSEKFKEYLGNNGVVISAQRILRLPTFDSISNPEITANSLREEQTRGKTYKNEHDFRYINNEFEIILKHLLAENISSLQKYKIQALNKSRRAKLIDAPQITTLDKTIDIWNSLIEHRCLSCEDGINFKTFIKGSEKSYASIQMSDGEKVLLYLIAQVLLAPEKGFIVIDEPEMYLHKTILKRLWDILETERNDCIFIYLTHDLDFATSRIAAKKIWLKSYTHPNYWEIEKIESDVIPQSLLFELVGSRKNILFCEGKKGSIDEKLYSLLFPNFTITPVESCFNVIYYTKAFNKIHNINIKAYGIIDSDHHSRERLIKIKRDNIFSISVSEIENLFLDEKFLNNFSKELMIDSNTINELKQKVIERLHIEKEIQISNYISTKINNIFTDSDLSKGNTIQRVKDNYELFLSKINISDFYNQRKAEIESIINSHDYEKAITVFNNKGLISIPSRFWKIPDFTDKCINFIQTQPNQLDVLKKYFPEELFIKY